MLRIQEPIIEVSTEAIIASAQRGQDMCTTILVLVVQSAVMLEVE